KNLSRRRARPWRHGQGTTQQRPARIHQVLSQQRISYDRRQSGQTLNRACSWRLHGRAAKPKVYEDRITNKPNTKMKTKIVVIGGSGLIGAKLVKNLRQQGHEVLPASPSSGVNTLTGEGLAEALAGAQVVVDVANAPQWDDKAVLEFFETAGRNLLAAEAAAGVRHHVALSIVGADRLPASGYLRAKLAQENLIKASKVPFTIVR